MIQHGFLRVAAASPLLRVADCGYNAEQIVGLLKSAEADAVSLVVFPELSLTGYTCADLFQHGVLQRGALDALEYLTIATASHFSGVAVVGLPLAVDDQVFNCAAVLHQGRILGVVPKSFIPNYKEFYEGRWFAAAATARSREITLHGETVAFGTDRLFTAADVDGLTLGVEICEDLWVPIQPSSAQALAGATVLVNLSASNEVIGKANYRRQLVVNQSGRCMAAYIYAACGVSESTTDVVFGGHCLIAENGTLLAESRRFRRDGFLLTADVDLERLRADRMRTNSFGAAQMYLHHDRKTFSVFHADRPRPAPTDLRRSVEAHPFVPQGQEQLRERCEEIFQTQVAGLAKRLEHIGKPAVAIGISGGLDSTLALLVVCKTLDALAVPRNRILAFTMPGFGTSSRTRDNARTLMASLGVQAREVDIRPLCLEEMRALNHKPFGIDLAGLTVETLTERFRHIPPDQCEDLVFENVQARMRTSILMNAGFVIGTGDVSEAALGWCTYNGDHMSMYNPNSSIPKTLVKFLVDWAARNEFDGEVRRTLLDVVDTIISPELLPLSSEGKQQATESSIGPYELHDFFLYHFLRYGASPEKILFLAKYARFHQEYSAEGVRRWLQVFVRRFFTNQFKRSCLPDGPKVGSISLSPRGDWRMPSDAQARLWKTPMKKVESLKHAIILRGPPAIGKTKVADLLLAKITQGQSKRIDLDKGWGQNDGWRYPGGNRRYADLQTDEDFLILELACGEPADYSCKGATKNPREWVSILEVAGRRILSFWLWADFDTWKQRLLKKAPGGDPGAEHYFRLFETDEWKQFQQTARVHEEVINTTTVNEQEVANLIWGRIEGDVSAEHGSTPDDGGN